MIKVEKEVSNDYIIKGFKHFTQLATEYFQGHPDCNAARKRMRDTIDANLQLKAELTAASYTEHTTLLSPKMQQIIWVHWGPPIIHCRKTTQTNRTTNEFERPKSENRTIYF